MNAEQLVRVRLSSNRTSRIYLPRRARLEIEQITGAAREKKGEVWRWRADGRPAVYGCALPLRLQKERPFFPTFGDKERKSFFQEPKGFGSADGWTASGRPAGGGAFADSEEGSSTDRCSSNHRTTGCTASSCERTALRAISEHCSPGGWGGGAACAITPQ